jgi:NADPH-dependent 2,4-dienoyl-CoA reductase/sulfur reductase-like enzyme
VHLVAVGGSDAGIAAALRARELDSSVEVSVVVADRYPNFSICGIPYHVSGDVPDWRRLAHRSIADLQAAGVRLLLDTTATAVEVHARRLSVAHRDGHESRLCYDELVIGTGATPVRPPIGGLTTLGPDHGVFLLHTMEDTFALTEFIDTHSPATAIVVGAGYLGLEMAEALTVRGMRVTQVEMLAEVLPTVDSSLGRLVRDRLTTAGVDVVTETAVHRIDARGTHLRVRGDHHLDRTVDLVLVVAGVQPDTALAAAAGARLGPRGAIEVDRRMRTGIPHVWAAGDCVVTHHRLLGTTYLPLGTTAHKQGRIAGENAIGGNREFAGVLGTQVVKVFDLAAARTGLRDTEARQAGFDPLSVESDADDHKAYYPGAHSIRIRVTADAATRRLLGVQMVGHKDAAVAKRIDIAATAIHHGVTVDELADLDLSYTPPLGSPWDAIQMAAHAWERTTHEPPASNLAGAAATPARTTMP